MDAKRRLLAMAFAAALALVVVLLLMDGEKVRDLSGRGDEGGHVPRTETPGSAVLVGRGHDDPDPASRQTVPEQQEDESRLVQHEVEVLDYRSAPVEGVRVSLERDWNDHSSGTHVRGWRVLDQGTTDSQGRVTLAADPRRREDLQDGLNHRLRFQPPEDREDLGATWRLWRPEARVTYRFDQMHVLCGTVLDARGQGVAGATVFIGDLPNGDYVIINPEWDQTTTDPEGQFEFRDIPTTRNGMLDV